MKSRNKYILGSLLSAMTLSLGSCVNDFYDESQCDRMETNTIGYMAVNLMPADIGTRASTGDAFDIGDAFDVGNAADFALASKAGHFAVFYTEGQDLPIAIAPLSGMNSNIEGENDANTTVVFATIASKNEQKEVLQKLNDCYILLNTNLNSESLWKYTKDDLLKIEVESPFYYDNTGKRFFTMCNSVYVENGKKKIKTDVDTSMIFTSYMQAIEEAWKGNAAVNAYVERLAARFGVRFENEDYNNADAERIFEPEDNNIIVFDHLSSGEIPYYKNKHSDGTDITYKVKITGWGLNALEKSSYLFRNFNPEIHYFTGWYNTDYKRAYWSEDVNYSNAIYPWQYRKVIDNTGIPVYENRDNLLLNLSFADINSGGWSPHYRYTPENTYDFADAAFSGRLDNRPEMLAGTHYIICAELLTNVDSPNEWKSKDIYRDRNGNFYIGEKECFKALVSAMNNHLLTHSFLKFTYWDWSAGGVENKLFAKTTGNYALYYNGRKLTPDYIDQLLSTPMSVAEFKGSDGKRIIWMDGMSIQDEFGNPLKIFSKIDEVDSKNDVFLRDATLNDLKSVIFEHVGAVDHFKDGKMFYAVPVGYIKSSSSQTDNDSYSVYGVVRNCSYDLLIKGVQGIGASVDDEYQPIVPNSVTTSDNLFIGFDILDWHLTENTVPGAIN